LFMVVMPGRWQCGQLNTVNSNVQAQGREAGLPAKRPSGAKG
jgi:hypothetical protein